MERNNPAFLLQEHLKSILTFVKTGEMLGAIADSKHKKRIRASQFPVLYLFWSMIDVKVL
jgi:hypothetical protein